MKKALALLVVLLGSVSVHCQAGESVMSTQLTPKQHAIVPIASRTTTGDMSGLSIALREGLDAGLTINEIKEVLVQLYAYVGFPRSLNALAQFSEVLTERASAGQSDVAGPEASPFPPAGKTSLECGTEVQTALVGAPVKGGLMDFAPAVDQFLKAHLFGDIFGRDNLDWHGREIATVSALASLPGAESQLRSHLAISLNIGISPDQLRHLATVLHDTVDASVGDAARTATEEVVQQFHAANKSVASIREAPQKFHNEEVADGIIFPRGPTNDAYANYFTGTSYLTMLTTAGVPIGNVTFEPGCRNNWHTHHKGGQILLVTGGRGWYQEAGKAPQELHPGDVVSIPAGAKHWHGAARDSWFVHLAVSIPAEDASTEWHEPVSDEEYGTLP